MKRIINIIIDFLKTHKKHLAIFTSALISLGVICGIFIYNNGVQNKKEKELLSRIDNLEEQIKKEEELSEEDENDTNSADSPSKENETDSTDINSKEEVETQSNNTTTNKEESSKSSNGTKTESTDTLPPSPGPGESIDSSMGKPTSGGSNEGDTSGVGEGSDELVVLGRNGIKGINASRFGECLTVVSLTTNNWKTHISSTQIGEATVLVGKTDKYYRVEKCRLELKHIETGEVIVYSFPDKYDSGGELPKDFNLNNYECTSVTGKIYFVNLPKEAIYTPLPEWDYNCGFMINGFGGERPYEIQSKTGRIYPNGVEDWEAKYMKWMGYY